MTGSRQRGRGGAGAAMRAGADGLCRLLVPTLAVLALASPAQAQFFSDRPAPVPPAAVPGIDTGPAINLAPSTGPATGLPQPLLQPGGPVGTPLSGPNLTPTAGQGVLALSARFGKDAGPIPGGLVWRIYAEKPDANGAMRLMKEDRGAAPSIMLPPGNYVVHASLGMASAMKTVTLRQDTTREVFEIPAGGLRIEGRVGTSRIPPGQISFDVYKGSQFDTADSQREPMATNVPAGDAVLLPEGTYYIVSNYGDANSVVCSDIRVQTGKLTDVTVQHRAAVITLKLVSDRGGEALANTAWSVITPGGDVVKESIGAFPRVVLAEGEYRAIAKNEGKMFERTFKVVTGVDGEIEVLAR